MQVIASIAYEQGQRIDKDQGQNSLGVYLCKDTGLSGEFAVKVIGKSQLPDPSNFWSESQAMYRSRHENVVPVQYACWQGDKIMLAMPYFRRGSLADRIAAGPLRILEVIRVGQGILSGLSQIHVAGHLHYDLKPSNVLFSDHDVPLVADFGQSKVIGPNGLASSPDRLYAASIPPEILQNQTGTRASDVYQAALTLYRAANGNPFFDEQFYACGADLGECILDGSFPDRDSYLPHVPRTLRGVINKGLHVDVSKRYANALEFAAALGRVHVKNDWLTICNPNQEVEWRSQRSGCPDLVVRLTTDGTKWSATIHHERPGRSVATKRILWRDGLTYRQAIPHLKQVFVALE